MTKTLTLIVNEQVREVEVGTDILSEGEEFFARMDRDMDGGWQMSRDWIESPDPVQRCQIVADRIVSAMAAGKHDMARLLAGYILTRNPEVTRIEVDTSGEVANSVVEVAAPEPAASGSGMSPEQASARAEREVADVYRVGRAWRFAAFDPLLGSWVESESFDSEDAARRMRAEAVAERTAELMAGV